ncbi:MAG: germination protein YpeB [Peptococcia bacterium]
MKKWTRWIFPGALALVLVGTIYWGYTEYISRQTLQNRAESQYQKAFHELTWHIDNITGQLAQLLVSTSREQNIIGLATLWRQSFAAQSNLGTLPLGLVPLTKTEKLLSDITDMSFALLNRTAQGASPLTEEEQKIIQGLYETAKGLEEEMSNLSAQVLNEGLSWTQVELALVQSDQAMADNTILNGFQLAEKKLEEYPEINLAKDLSPVLPDTVTIRGGQELSQEEARQLAQSWWYQNDIRHNVTLNYEGVGDIPTYGFEFAPAEGESSAVYVDVSKLDGTIIWTMNPREVTEANLDLNQAEEKALDFLQKRNFPQMTVVKVEQDDHTGVYSFVPVQQGVLLYPDQVKVQVALDNGEIIGYEGTPYYMHHKKREIKAPRLSEEDIRKQVSILLEVELMRPAIITNPWGKEVLTWEVRGSVFDEKFVIFYNSENGSEEQITRITPETQHQFIIAS